jgi:hypothetical protein
MEIPTYGTCRLVYDGVSKIFRTGRLEQEQQMVQLSATRCSCITILLSQSSEFCRHNSLCCFSATVYCSKGIFRYRLSPGTFGYTLVCIINSRLWGGQQSGWLKPTSGGTSHKTTTVQVYQRISVNEYTNSLFYERSINEISLQWKHTKSFFPRPGGVSSSRYTHFRA